MVKTVKMIKDEFTFETIWRFLWIVIKMPKLVRHFICGKSVYLQSAAYTLYNVTWHSACAPNNKNAQFEHPLTTSCAEYDDLAFSKIMKIFKIDATNQLVQSSMVKHFTALVHLFYS